MATTESASGRYAGIETWSTRDLVDGLVEAQFTAVAALQAAAPDIARAIDLTAERLAAGGRMVYLGAGTSGRIAAQDAAELPPTYGWPAERAVVLMAGGRSTLLASAESAEDDTAAAPAALDELSIGKRDVVVGVTASGRTPYVLAGVKHARKVGAMTVGLFNNRSGELAELAELPILLETGPEPIAGSTRMKAGTAQKAALNALSTGVMIKLGFVYRGLMVEMRPTNAKLKKRAVEMVATLAGVKMSVAGKALTKADGSIKIAVVMLARSLDPFQARALLDKSGGNLGRAMTR